MILLDTIVISAALIAAQALNRRACLVSSDGDFHELAGLAGLKLLSLAS